MAKMRTRTRWSEWEHAVVSKLENPDNVQQSIIARQQEFDDDDQVTTLIRDQIKTELKKSGLNPAKELVFIPSKLLAEWVTKATGTNMPVTKVTPYLTKVGVPELQRAPRKASGSGWIWRGSDAVKSVPLKDFETIMYSSFQDDEEV